MLILMCSAIFDALFHRIPNWLIGIGMIIGIVQSASGGIVMIIWFLIKTMVVITLGFPLFRCRMLGAGDLKLMSLICSFLGLYHGFVFIFYGLTAGAVVSLYRLCSNGCLIQRLSYLFHYLNQLFQTKKISYYYNITSDGYRMTIPLAVYLFIGGLFSFIRNRLGGM